jgi:5-methyltetrahydropteroyltriglutamate--homocysteine methyltransferase
MLEAAARATGHAGQDGSGPRTEPRELARRDAGGRFPAMRSCRPSPVAAKVEQQGDAAMTANRIRPPFRADHVGSLLRPERLFAARTSWQRGESSREELAAVEDECVRQAVRMQEDVGLEGITDGDFRRNDWFLDFITSLEGIGRGDNVFEVRFSNDVSFETRALAVTGPVRCPEGGIMVEDFEFLKSVTSRTAKVCIPAPCMMHSVVPQVNVDAVAYPDPDALMDDVARAFGEAIEAFGNAGCTYLQADDVNSTALVDANRQAMWRSLGFDPAERLDAFIRLNNAAFRARPRSMTLVVHMCRGNYQSQWSGEGGYDMVAERYFGESDVDGFFLEYDDSRSGGFEALRHVPKDKTVVLGIVTSKRPHLEAKDQLIRRIEEAACYVPLENLGISPQCGFASTREGNRLTEDQQRRKLELLVDVAETVWGEV